LETNFENIIDANAFWLSRLKSLPNLAKFVQFYFIKLPSSGSVERLFSVLAHVGASSGSNVSSGVMENRVLFKENMIQRRRYTRPVTCDKDVESLTKAIMKELRKRGDDEETVGGAAAVVVDN